MEKYKRRAQLMCDLYEEKVRTTQYQLDAYRDVYMEAVGIPSPADLWAYLDAEKKKASFTKEEYPSFDEWEEAKNRLAALENAEKWLRKVEEMERENGPR